MQQYAKDLDFEAAIACRDALSEIKSHFLKPNLISKFLDGYFIEYTNNKCYILHRLYT